MNKLNRRLEKAVENWTESNNGLAPGKTRTMSVMKIELDIENSCGGRITIDGKEMRVAHAKGLTRLEGVTARELHHTLGGLIAEKLYGKVIEIGQAWAAATDEHEGVKTWEEISDDVFDAAEDCIW